MIIFYFSGTGNTKYVANRLAEDLNCESHSIEDDFNFKSSIAEHDVIAVSYPIYGSAAPLIMREFVRKYKNDFQNKKIAIFVTQLLFSGDGARVLTDELTNIDYEVIYAEHFRMPNNLPAKIPGFAIKNGKDLEKRVAKTNVQIHIASENIKNGKVIKRGFNPFSKILGMPQRIEFYRMEKKLRGDVRIDDSCVKCNVCVNICPTKNLEHVNQKIQKNNLCIFCQRCVHVCPKRAISVFPHYKGSEQYKGVK